MSRLAAVVGYIAGLQMLVLVYLPHWGPGRTAAVGACFLGKLVLLLRVPRYGGGS